MMWILGTGIVLAVVAGVFFGGLRFIICIVLGISAGLYFNMGWEGVIAGLVLWFTARKGSGVVSPEPTGRVAKWWAKVWAAGGSQARNRRMAKVMAVACTAFGLLVVSALSPRGGIISHSGEQPYYGSAHCPTGAYTPGYGNAPNAEWLAASASEVGTCIGNSGARAGSRLWHGTVRMVSTLQVAELLLGMLLGYGLLWRKILGSTREDLLE